MNTNARLDHLLDRFKHDIRDLIDSAVAEERTGLMNRLEKFIDTDGDIEVKVAEPVIEQPKQATITLDKTLIEDTPVVPEPACEQCQVNPIGMNGYGSKKYCSKKCGSLAIAKSISERHRKKALSR